MSDFDHENYANDLKSVLFEILEKDRVEKFSVEFYGQDDDGQVSSILNLNSDVLDITVQGVKLFGGMRCTQEGYEPYWSNKESVTVEDVIQNLCYKILNDNFSGWEINEGSYGTFTFDVKEKNILLDFNQRIVDNSEHEF